MGWLINATPRLIYLWEREQVPIVQEAGWAPGPVSPPGFDPRSAQPIANLYPGPWHSKEVT